MKLDVLVKHLYELVDYHYGAGAELIGAHREGKSVFFYSSLLPESEQFDLNDEIDADSVYQALHRHIGKLKPRYDTQVAAAQRVDDDSARRREDG